MADLQVALTGTLSIRPTPSSPPKQAASTGCNFGLSLRDGNESAQNEISQACYTVVGAGFVALPFPATLLARLLYMRSQNTTPFDVRITRVVSAQSTILQVRGLLVLEFENGDEVTAIEVQGAGAQFEWAASGQNA